MKRCAGFSVLVLLGLFVDVHSSRADAPKHIGTAGCSSSNCHGSASPRNVTSILQNEYITWLKHDRHAGSWKILLNEDSKKIAKHLGISNPESDTKCTVCHTTEVAAKDQGEKFHKEDGVSCEACHGPAEKWLGPHAEKNATRERNLELGMVDLSTPAKQATLCLSCHYGNENRAVTHRLIGAGHPRLTFELDTFSSIEPRHWDVDADYVKRKGDYAPFTAWIASQLVRAESSLAQLKSKERTFIGVFPDFALFYCSSCHHSLKNEEWKKRDYNGAPGEVRLNTASLQMLSFVLKQWNPSLSAELDNHIEAARSAINNGEITNASQQLARYVEAKVRPALAPNLDKRGMGAKHLPALIRYGAEQQHPTYEVAEQILMGISAALAEHPANEGALKPLVDKAYETLSDPREFDAEPFMAAMQKLKGAL